MPPGLNANRIYDVVTNTLDRGCGPALAARLFMASGYYNGKIYLIGGYSTSYVTPTESQVWECDPVAIPIPRRGWRYLTR